MQGVKSNFVSVFGAGVGVWRLESGRCRQSGAWREHRSAQWQQLDLLAAELGLGLTARLQTQLGGVGHANHQVAVELDLGRVVAAAASLAAAFAALPEAQPPGFQQGLVEGREVEAFRAVLPGAQIAAAAHPLGLGNITEFLDLGPCGTPTGG